MIRKILIYTAILIAAVLSVWNISHAENAKTTIEFFWAEGCPHCAAENSFLNKYLSEHQEIKLEKYEVSKSQENQKRMLEIAKRLEADANGVPFTVIGDQYIIGFIEGTTEQKIKDAIARHIELINEDSESGEVCAIDEPCEQDKTNNDTKIKIPFIGEKSLASFSLPTLSIVVGLVDGFNPCAMWTLLFLISLLLGMKDRKRMWILGSAFIVASASVYFIFMAAWLNLLLFIGLISTVRIIIGLVALAGGSYNLKEFFTSHDSGCKVSKSSKQQAVFAKIKKIIHEKSFLVALLGIILLAFAVNLVELICSAGLPAVFTQVLAMSNLNKWQYYLYIALYIFFFMLDDLVVFFIAMITLQLTGITTRYSKWSKLIGGIIMLVIGLLMIFKPSWLMFG